MNYKIKKLNQKKQMYYKKIEEIELKIMNILNNDKIQKLKDEMINSNEFMQINGYTNYLINKQGKIYSLKNKKFIKSYKANNGYYMVCLWKNGGKKSHLVHRLVANAFIPNLNNYKEVNHKDFNTENNSIENLEWCSRSYNLRYSNLSKWERKPILQILNDTIINEFNSITEAEKYGYDSSHISKCCKNKQKRHKGYIWKYKEQLGENYGKK